MHSLQRRVDGSLQASASRNSFTVGELRRWTVVGKWAFVWRVGLAAECQRIACRVKAEIGASNDLTLSQTALQDQLGRKTRVSQVSESDSDRTRS